MILYRYSLLFVFILLITDIKSQSTVMSTDIYNILDFGAKTDKNTLNTYAIQQAIDACEAGGGGTVFIPAGKYVTGTIFLKRNLNLHLAADAFLLGSHYLKDYSDNVHVPVEAPSFAKCLLYAENVENVSITGKGTIDGRGSKEYFDHWGERPMLMRFYKCKNILIRDVNLRNSASWNTHLIVCEKIRIDGISIYNRVQPNNDGIDFDGCKDLFISNCKFDTDDDPICGKSTFDLPTENVVITNCVIRSNCSGFKLGTSSKGIYRNITISNCIMKDIHRGAIKLICVDGGIIENVNISDIVMDNVEGPFFIRLGARGKTYEEAKDQDYTVEGVDAVESTPVGQIRDISISNIRARVTGKDTAQAGVMITGVPGHYVENVNMSNIHVIFPGGGTSEDANRVVPEDEKRYPEQSFFGTLPSYAVFARHAKGLIFNNWTIRYEGEEERPAFVLDDVIGAEFIHMRIQSSASEVPLVKDYHSEKIFFHELRPLNGGY